ncbi:hypothetical protein MF271_11365 [Deinococcus sp. KNUC1210]|uniref:hypothetical protein n=1 Tax=Deinococcus sp. KNUC1210 TaxID=2917691 RepID=UPI001EF068BA|nr:hypothetical protein [Deinococcus sp. KNUC1210]ULH14611.1 hypothetical protein MF271_11365 [Deinococcus sp. KNUC1210]
MASSDSSAHSGLSSLSETLLITIDVLDQESGMAEVEDSLGRNFELPAAWLPDAAEGLAYRVQPHPDGVRFEPLPGGARELRERSKQTLLEFSDEHEGEEHSGQDQP